MPAPSVPDPLANARRASIVALLAAALLGVSLMVTPAAAAQDECDFVCQGAIVTDDGSIGDLLGPDPIVDVVANPDFNVAAVIDSDGDGLTDADEANIYGTNPYEADTDFDFITDDVEINLYGTDPTYSDTDADGLSDNDEFVYGAAPLVWDTDGDRLRDGNEVYVYGTRPGDVDSDDDGYWDGHELDTCHDPLNPGDHPSSYSNTPCWVGAPNS